MDKEMNKRVRVEYLRRVRLLAKSKLNAGNLVLLLLLTTRLEMTRIFIFPQMKLRFWLLT